tara:strand:- start:533 stop:1453 length:921 start_codon:yes stop_codon:yes gene_type:complete
MDPNVDSILRNLEARRRDEPEVQEVIQSLRTDMILKGNKSKLNEYLRKIAEIRKIEANAIMTILSQPTASIQQLDTAYASLQRDFNKTYALLENSVEFKQFLLRMTMLDEQNVMRTYFARTSKPNKVDEMRNELMEIVRENLKDTDADKKLNEFTLKHNGFALPSTTLKYWGGAKLPLHINGLVVRDWGYYRTIGITKDPTCDQYGHKLIIQSLSDDAIEGDYVTVPHSLERQNIKNRDVYYDSDGDECTAHGGYWTWDRGCKKLGKNKSQCKTYIEDKWDDNYPRSHPKIGLCRELVQRGFLHEP